MKFRKKLFIFLIILLVISAVFSTIYIHAVGSHYTKHTGAYFSSDGGSEIKDWSVRFENDGVVRISDVWIDSRGEAVIEFDAVADGETDVFVDWTVRYHNDQTENTADGEAEMDYKYSCHMNVLATGLLVDTTKGTIDFQAFPVVLFVFLANLLAILIVMILLFFDFRKNGEFGYKMIACAGLSILVGVLLLFMLYKRLNHVLRTCSDAINLALDIGNELFLAVAPPLLVLSVLLSVSNIWLMRHEGYRPVNALGIVFGVLWTIGVLVILNVSLIRFLSDIVDLGIVQRIILYLFCYFGAMFIATVLCAYLSTKYRSPYDRDYIIILGCCIRSDGTLTPLLQARVDAALAFEKEQFDKTGRHAVFVPSGGQGADEVISESQAMKNYLLEQGVPEKRILTEDKSINTMQNMQFSKQVIEKHAGSIENCKIAFATTNYHIFRGYILAKKNGFSAKGISAKTKKYFYPNAFLREFIGLLVDRKFDHIAFVLLTLAVFVVLNIAINQAYYSALMT